VIFGRAATFGAPFAHLMRLSPGDEISVVTGQGRSTYRVADYGTGDKPAPDTDPNRLVLETGDSSLFSTGFEMVTADLVTAPQPNPGGWPTPSAQEAPLAGDTGAVLPLVLWSQALLLILIGAAVGARRWSPWPTLLCAVPAALAVTWCVYENAAILLPNLN
jgi:sortase A